MNKRHQLIEHNLYEFESSFQISYVKCSRTSSLVPSQFCVTLERDGERKTFAFRHTRFIDIAKNLIMHSGIYIAAIKNSESSLARIEVGDLEGGFAYFTASSVRNITPAA